MVPRLRGAATSLPGAITVGNLLAGYASILMAARGRFWLAGLLILTAAALDGIDGRVARLVGGESPMGEHLDSLADAVSFAVAPSALAFHMGLASLGRAGWAVCFLFTACGVLRLARFNVGAHDYRYFIGLPIPTAAAIAACPVLFTNDAPMTSGWIPVHAVIMVITGGLMVSRVRFRTFKDLRFGQRPYRILALWSAILVGFVTFPEWMLPILIVGYLLSPLVSGIQVRIKKRRAPPPWSPATPGWREPPPPADDHDRLPSAGREV